MKPKPIINKLPKLSKKNKSIFCDENKLRDSLIQRKAISVELDNHPLFRKRIVRLKEKKLKKIIDSKKSSFFSNESSVSEFSSMKDIFDPKNASLIDFNINKLLRKNSFDISLFSKPSSLINTNRSIYNKNSKLKYKQFVLRNDLKLNYSRYNFIKSDEIFLKFVIERFIKNKKMNTKNININKKKRRIYTIMQNTIVTNVNDIPGYFINIPCFSSLNLHDVSKRQKMFKDLLVKLNNIFGCKRKIESLFSPDKEVILDLLDIKKEYKFIYVSQTIVCKSISIVISPNFIRLYNYDYQDYLCGIKYDNYKKIKNKKKKEFKIENIIKGIKPKYEKLKPHYSFSAGENDIENINYICYSDDEEKKDKIIKDKNKEIYNQYIFKNDFFLYLNNNELCEKLKSLKQNLNYKTPFKLKESYDNFKVNFEKLLYKFSKELKKKYGLNPKNFNLMNESNKNDNYDFCDSGGEFDKLFIPRKGEKIRINNKYIQKNYTQVDRKITRQYSHLVMYNIPKMLTGNKSNSQRKKFFEIFIQFKDLISLAIRLKRDDFILKNGLDFETFWNCISEIQDESESFAKKLFSNMNKSNSSLLNIEDFLNGMNFIKNTSLGDKIELYLKSLSHTGYINYKTAIKISFESILKYIENSTFEKNEKLLLNDLSTFLASYIFKLVGQDIRKNLSFEELKRLIDNNSKNFSKVNNKDLEYLEMFCGI